MSEVRENFFSTKPQISLISRDIFAKREKRSILLHFCFFFLSEEGNLKLPHWRVLTILLTRTLYKIKTLKLKRLNDPKLG